jgi:rhamnosyltransferase
MNLKSNIRSMVVGVVVYNPTYKFIERINAVVKSGFDVYLLDNSPEDSKLRESFCNENKVHYITLGKNVGLGIGITAICGQAYYEGNKELVFFDQDTGFNDTTLSFIEYFAQKNSEQLSSYSMVNFNAKELDANKGQNNAFKLVEASLVINSGSLFFLDILKDMGWHDLSYFVDSVDYKFCLDSAVRNYKVGECKTTPGFDHVTEQDDSVYTFFGHKFMARKYSNRRVKDTLYSLLRLIGSSLINFKLVFFMKFSRFLIIYILVQSYVRIVPKSKV